jgi:hypothetical protein
MRMKFVVCVIAAFLFIVCYVRSKNTAADACEKKRWGVMVANYLIGMASLAGFVVAVNMAVRLV